MISWQTRGALNLEDYQLRSAEVTAAWHGSGLVIAYTPEDIGGKLLSPPDAIADIPWIDIYNRGQWGGAGGAEVTQQLFDWIIVNIWPYAKIAGAAAAAGVGYKAGGELWDLCVRGLKKGVGAVLGRSAHKVYIDVVQDANLNHDVTYELDEESLNDLDTAIEALRVQAQGVHQGKLPRSSHMRWNSVRKDWEDHDHEEGQA